MAHGQFATDHGNEISQIRTMAYKRKQRTIFLEDCLPIIAVKVRVVKVFALGAPRLAKDLFPLCTRLDTRLELRNIYWSVANLDWTIRHNYSPRSTSARCGLIQYFLL